MPAIDLLKTQRLMNWASTKVFLHSNAGSAAVRKIKRGEIYWCYLGENIGSEESKKRPCLIVQNDSGNTTSPNTIVAPITNAPGDPRIVVPINTQMHPTTRQVIIEGYVLTANIVTVSKARLGNCITTLTKPEMDMIDNALTLSLGMQRRINALKNDLQNKTKYIIKLKEKILNYEEILEEVRNYFQVEENKDIRAVLVKTTSKTS